MQIDFKSGCFTAPHLDRLQALHQAPLASFHRRAAAWVLDLCLVVLLALVILGIQENLDHDAFDKNSNNEIKLELFHSPWGLAAVIGYFGLLPFLWHGRTIGKRLFRVRIVSLTHDRLSLWQCVERALGYGFSSLEGGFGFIQYFIHPNHQTLHDRIAETVVIKEERKQKVAITP